ncbi:Protein DSF2 [Zancudomyces culisetae]|uniref:Protein DSF2 n=1 Tax=Zancudomyces culisetae TaxID=1213189 RepID=A0A1R1PNE7_ZANCU|nr:Protein DSF2 [Zancudomyces culisetae]|eukprot:OMH82486.1 Protein DSF2 [Zancudomyces culisetae]
MGSEKIEFKVYGVKKLANNGIGVDFEKKLSEFSQEHQQTLQQSLARKSTDEKRSSKPIKSRRTNELYSLVRKGSAILKTLVGKKTSKSSITKVKDEDVSLGGNTIHPYSTEEDDTDISKHADEELKKRQEYAVSYHSVDSYGGYHDVYDEQDNGDGAKYNSLYSMNKASTINISSYLEGPLKHAEKVEKAYNALHKRKENINSGSEEEEYTKEKRKSLIKFYNIYPKFGLAPEVLTKGVILPTSIQNNVSRDSDIGSIEHQISRAIPELPPGLSRIITSPNRISIRRATLDGGDDCDIQERITIQTRDKSKERNKRHKMGKKGKFGIGDSDGGLRVGNVVIDLHESKDSFFYLSDENLGKRLTQNRKISRRMMHLKGEETFHEAVDKFYNGEYNEAFETSRISAECLNSKGMLLYGLCLRHGWGTDIDLKMAFKFIKKAVGCGFYVYKDILKRRQALQPKDQKNPESIVLGIEESDEMIFFPLSLFELGQSYYHGWGVIKSPPTAIQYLEIAAEFGFIDAILFLGSCYESGNGKWIKKDLKRSAQYYRAAHKLGCDFYGNSWIFKKKFD